MRYYTHLCNIANYNLEHANQAHNINLFAISRSRMTGNSIAPRFMTQVDTETQRATRQL